MKTYEINRQTMSVLLSYYASIPAMVDRINETILSTALHSMNADCEYTSNQMLKMFSKKVKLLDLKNHIDRAFVQLKTDEFIVLALYFVKETPTDIICQKLKVSSRTMFRRINMAVEHLHSIFIKMDINKLYALLDSLYINLHTDASETHRTHNITADRVKQVMNNEKMSRKLY